MSEFVFMLTNKDRTVDNALEVLEQLNGCGLQHIGFKDVGASPKLQAQITERARELGYTVYLEIVSVSVENELESVEAAIAADVDWIVGGKHAERVLEKIAGTGIKFAPFPGRVVGHPSELQGSIEEIVEHAIALESLEGVTGLDLLAYRDKSVDVPALMKAVVDAVSVPVLVAGAVTVKEQIAALNSSGAWGFTIGGAIFDGVLPGEKDVASQVRTALSYAASM